MELEWVYLGSVVAVGEPLTLHQPFPTLLSCVTQANLALALTDLI